jgi:hypothetical protein
LAVGDSVMLGAKKVLTEKIPTMTVDAAVSRRFDQAAGVLSFYASHGLLPRIVVVDLGTNDEVTDELFDHVVRAIGPGHRVFFLTVRVPRPWEKATNDALDRGALRWGADVQVLDWRDYAGCHDDWFLRDGFHLEPVGQQAFAQFILDAITGHSGQGGQGGCAATPAATRITSGDAAIDVVSGWYASKEPLAWWLVSPREVFSIATSPLPPSPRKAPNEAACPSEIPQVAVDGIADDGAYLWIGEWHGGLYQADPRPAASNALILAPGCSLPRGEKAYLALLRDGRHDYSVTFVLGKDAPPSRRDDINRMLDSLRFSG